MLSQSLTIDRCLSALKECNLPTTTMTQLEAKIVKIKAALLNDRVAEKLRGDLESENEFHNLYRTIRHLYTSNCDTEITGKVSKSLADMVQRITTI